MRKNKTEKIEKKVVRKGWKYTSRTKRKKWKQILDVQNCSSRGETDWRQEAAEKNGLLAGYGKKENRGASPDLGRNRNSKSVAVFAEKGRKIQKGDRKWIVAAGKLRWLIVKLAGDVDLGWYAGKRMEEGKEVTAENKEGLTSERKK